MESTKIIPFIFWLTVILLSCKSEHHEKVIEVDLSTREMVQELESIAMDQSNVNVWHLNRLKATMLDEKLKSVTSPGEFITLSFNCAMEWLNAGEYSKALEKLNLIFTFINNKNLNLAPEAMYEMKEVLGIAYLRKAEIENCIQSHNEFSCIVPIDKDGQHTLREGSERALSIFRELLYLPEAKWQTRWLYNIAHMTLGSYPLGVEKQFLLEESLFKSEASFPKFKEMAMTLGIGVNKISGSVVMEDFNNDGFLDLMISSYGLHDQLKYFQNDKRGGFNDLTESAGITGLLSGLNMVQADFNNDGWVDVLILRGAWLGKDGKHPNSLLRNNGNGTFSDVTKESGLYSHFPTQTASWADFNNDGWIDLFIGSEFSQNIEIPSQLFQNKGNGTFENVAFEKGLEVKGFIKGCVWGDYDNDGFQDIYLSLINQKNYLFRNEGPDGNFRFSDQSLVTKTSEPILSFPCWFFDFNQDGWEDIFVSGFDFRQFDSAAGEVAKDLLGLPIDAELPRLYRNDKNGSFSEVSVDANINKVLFTMGCNYGDLNNDGYPDFYAATGTPDFRAVIPNRMFLNDNGKGFLDITTAGGFGHIQKGHGVAFGDLDNDGDQDVYTVLGGSYDGDNFMNALFVNPGNQQNWIKIKLRGVEANSSAIGARIKVIVSNKNGTTKIFHNKVSSGGSFGANPLLIEQGLGDFTNIESIEILWPGQVNPQILTNIEIRSFILVTQNNPIAEKINAQPIVFETTSHHQH